VAANLYGDQNRGPTDNDQQIVAMDHFGPAGTAQLQALREPDFVMESECGQLGPFDTEQGYIRFDGNTIPCELPLCITNDTIGDWYALVLSYGGYVPYDGFFNVYQKNHELMGTIYIQWKDAGKGTYDCCTYNWWNATFYVKQNFCLDSNQYPAGYCGDGQFIPGKEVTFEFTTKWTGCKDVSQRFTIIHSQSYQALSERIILALRTRTLCKHLNPIQSFWYHNKTAIVYNIFEPKNCTTED
jgi:hypothetical protein